MHQDVIVIGGSYAGMAAALQLLRARKAVTIIDADERRNRFASHSHGFLSRDGEGAGDIARLSRTQLERYPTLTWLDDTAQGIAGERDGFTVTTANGANVTGRRILLAVGVRDTLPDIPGLSERWGKSVFHCPYCHGYELDQGPVGVIAAGPMSGHQAEMLTEWGKTTFFVNGVFELEPDLRAALNTRGVAIEETPIAELTGTADVRLTDGRTLPFAGLFTAPVVEPAGPLPALCGCAFDETPMGRKIQTGAGKETATPGIYACGDAAHMPHSVSLAVADGAMTGAHIHRSLIWP